MGGHKAGEVASKLATEEFIKNYYSDNLKEEDIIRRIEISLEKTNKKIYELSKNSEEYKGMGTTIVGLIIKGGKGYIFNIGDSKCYKLNKNKIEQLSEDHSLVKEMLKQNIITEEEAKISNKKNILTRAIGTDEKVKPYINEIHLKEGDIFVLCTDGLINHVSENEILHILNNEDLKLGVDKLITLANERGGSDNITIIGISLSEVKEIKKYILISSAIFLIIFGLFFIFNNFIFKPKLFINTFPENAVIKTENNNILGYSPTKIVIPKDKVIFIEKDGYKREKIEIKRNGREYSIYKEGKLIIDNIIYLDKLIKIKVEPKDAIVKIDGKIVDISKEIALSLGKHKIEIEKENYYPMLENEINVDLNSQRVYEYKLEEIPYLTLNTKPDKAKLLIYNEKSNDFEYYYINNEILLTPIDKIDFNEIKGKKLRFIKEEDNKIFFKECVFNSIEEIEGDIILKEYYDINIKVSPENIPYEINLLNYDKEEELIKLDNNFYLILYENYKDKKIKLMFKNEDKKEIITISKIIGNEKEFVFDFEKLKININQNKVIIELNSKKNTESFKGKLKINNLNYPIYDFFLNENNKSYERNFRSIKSINISGIDEKGYEYNIYMEVE